MAYPPDDGSGSSNPRTLATVETPPPAEPAAPPVPTTKDEASDAATAKRKAWEAYKAEQIANGVMVDETSGKIVRLVKDEPAQAQRPPGFSDEEWERLQKAIAMKTALEGGSSKVTYSTIPDFDGQKLYDDWKGAELDAKEFRASGGAASAYVDAEPNKTKEITRQYHDFEDRASLLYDLMGDEQDYGMAADDQNIQNWKAQRDLGMAVSPGGFYTKPSLGSSLSQILAPSLPDYVRPDYRLNEAVGLPGPQGFDDPDYSSYGLPMYAEGTNPPPTRRWPWPPRNV